jgi:methionyl-tRNA formyltransferase
VDSRNSQEKPGTICEINPDAFCVQTGEGMLVIRELQLEGKKRMDTATFLRGYKLEIKTVLGE